jgi:hypothetical protein
MTLMTTQLGYPQPQANKLVLDGISWGKFEQIETKLIRI